MPSFISWLSFASVVLALPARADEPAAVQIAAAKKRFAAAKDSKNAGTEIVSILNAAKDDLAPLLADDDTSIALYAAWDTAKNRDAGDGSDWHWFVGFLQGRTGLTPPMRWEIALAGSYHWRPTGAYDKVLEGYLKRTDILTKSGKRIFLREEPRPEKMAGFFPAPGLVLSREGEGDLTITVSGERFVVPAALLKPSRPERFSLDRHVNALVADRRAFVAVHEQHGERFPLFCFDLRSGKLIWRADVWAAGAENLVARDGPWNHDVFLQSHKGSLVIYGDCPACYIESLDAVTGKPQFRFCSNAWYARPR
jgi:hypothetical protein